jgi:hypothetical protein
MKKPLLLTLLALLVGAFSVFCIWFLLITYVMRSIPAVIQTLMIAALVVIALALVAALIFAWLPGRGRAYLTALAVMLVTAIGSNVFSSIRGGIVAASRTAEDAAERRAIEAKFLSQLEANKKDLAERIATQRPFAPREAYKFVEFVKESDLSYRLLPDHSATTFPLLKQALDAKILDPNARLKGPTRVDVNEEPLFVVYYKFYLQSGATMPTRSVREREWKLLQMLVAAGANLDDPAAVVLRDVVNRETAPYEIPGYIRLK